MAVKKDKKKLRQKKIKKQQNLRKNRGKKIPHMSKRELEKMTEAMEKSFDYIDENMTKVMGIIDKAVDQARQTDPQVFESEVFQKEYEATKDRVREYKAEANARQLELAAFTGNVSKVEKLTHVFDDLDKELKASTESMMNLFDKVKDNINTEDKIVVENYIHANREPTSEEVDDFLNEIPDVVEQEEEYDAESDRS